MAKVTSKLQVTIPKAVADRLGIRPGDDVEWRVEANEARVSRTAGGARLTPEEREAIFSELLERQEARNRRWWRQYGKRDTADRGWTREELYTRGRPR